MDPEGFFEKLDEIYIRARQQGTEMWTAFAQTRAGNIPVALLTIQFPDLPGGRLAQPHVIWYPEASPRNRLEVLVMFLRDLKKDYQVLVISNQGDVSFFRHLGKYGLLRAIGTFRDFFGPKKHAVFFQAVV